MSEASEQVEKVQEAATQSVPVQRPAADWFLQQLVDYANEWGVGTGISLHLSGMVVSGEIMSANDYFDEFAAAYRDAFRTHTENGQAFFDLITSYKQYLNQPEGEDKVPPQYIHLRNVKIYTIGYHRQATSVPQWRGRISEVSGFYLGTLTTVE